MLDNITRTVQAMKQRTQKVVPGPATPNADSRPAEPGRRIRANWRIGKSISEDEKPAQAGRITRRATGQGKACGGMQLADITQLSTQSHTTAGILQPRSQRLAPEDGAAGVAWPGWPRRAFGGRRSPCGCHHAGHKGSPRAGSSGARPGCPSQVGAGRVLGVASPGPLGGRSRPSLIGVRTLLGAQ